MIKPTWYMGSFTVLYRGVKGYHIIDQPSITLFRNIFIQNTVLDKIVILQWQLRVRPYLVRWLVATRSCMPPPSLPRGMQLEVIITCTVMLCHMLVQVHLLKGY